MGQKEKLIRRLRSMPRDFTFEESETLLRYLGYQRTDKGRTSGSRVMFTSAAHGSIQMHKPHPGNELRIYQIRQLIALLEREGLI